MMVAKISLVVLISYLVGSVPFGLIVAKVGYGVDIRKMGSKNIGATNIFRVLGVSPGILVLLLDFSKGIFSVLLARIFFSGSSYFSLAAVLAGMAAILGHNFSLYLRFSGGRGVATGFGVVVFLFPWVSAVMFFLWLLVLIISRYVSLASIVASLSFPLLILIFYRGSYPYIIFSLAAAFIVIYRHRANISRLLRGEEFKFEFKKKGEQWKK